MAETGFRNSAEENKGTGSSGDSFTVQAPQIQLSKGGGSLKNIDEKFEVNPSNGTASLSIPLPVSPARNNFAPELSLSYNSGSGNGCFGIGWKLGMSSIQRTTDKKIPQYHDQFDSDTFLLTGMEDLVPFLKKDDHDSWVADETISPDGERVTRYRPRIEKNFYRIEQIRPSAGDTFYWKITTPGNIVTIYGRTTDAQIADPQDPSRIFKWMPEMSYDDKGNCMEYRYVKENLANVERQLYEQNRFNGNAAFANSYLKSVSYGNAVAYQPDPLKYYNPKVPENPGYLFEIVFDFGDHDMNNPSPEPAGVWDCRLDPFSDYHAGFEIRTYRICRRILFFHNFKELSDGVHSAPCLVRSLEIAYRYYNNSSATQAEKRNVETDFITALQQFGYKKKADGYTRKGLPPMEFGYQQLNWDTTVRDVTAENRMNAPLGLGNNYQWTDLWSEGIAGILTEQGNGWYYKSNLGDGNFSTAESIIPKPSFTGLSDGRLQLQDLEADGRKFLVSLGAGAKGFFEIGDQNEWPPFKSFDRIPNLNPGDRNVRFIDLNGDGRPDIVVSEENAFTWYPSLGLTGYDDPEIAAKPFDEEKGPAMVFADQEICIFLADMSGDGMTDIVRIRNGDICYWPNLGYGKFGAKVNMADAPVFDGIDQFNPAYLHLADISGTGATDLIYLGKSQCNVWLNLCGNKWSENKSIDGFPGAELPNQITVVDFLGNGTPSLVWSSELPLYTDTPLRYIDLMGGKKPYVISSYKNNTGKQVSWEYRSSAFFYLQDKLAGTPWITLLPFPVQCVSSVMTRDLTAGLLFTNSYQYHHGYYDFQEKEFRGFGKVEQIDTEDYENFILSGASNVQQQDLHQAPVKKITWFHTGAYLSENRILNQFEQEYYKSAYEFDLPQPALPGGMTGIECREALRACKGMILRQETYGLDGSPVDTIPYSVSKHNCQVKVLQPRQAEKYAVFYTPESEGATFHYERNENDPRIAHILNLEVDDFGNVLQSALVVYGRKITDSALPAPVQNEQSKLHVLYTLNSFTNNIDTAAALRLPLPSESAVYELTGIKPGTGSAFLLNELLIGFSSAAKINFEETADNIHLQKRLTRDTRTIYLKNDLVTPLPLNNLDSLGFVYRKYKLAFTPSLRAQLFGSIDITDAMMAEAKFAQVDGLNWWIQSGTNNYLGNGETVTDARLRFFSIVSTKDAFNNETLLTYDTYFLLLSATEDAVNNKTIVEETDYRVLHPSRIKDMNENTSEVLFDELGTVIATAVYGSEEDGMHGDKPLAGYMVVQPVNLDEIIADPHKFLQKASSFYYYDYDAWMNNMQPAFYAGIIREKHESELVVGEISPVILNVGYTGGLGQILQVKMQADPGKALQWNNNNLETVDTGTNPRWVGTGRTELNNKGKLVKQYEPFFSTTYKYETEKALVEIGFSSIWYYDALGRTVRKSSPNGTFSTVEFDAWKQLEYDENDTVRDSTWYTEHGSPDPASPEPTDPGTRAAWLAANHAGTPAEKHYDSLGRPIFSIANNGADGKYGSLSVLDIANNQLSITDARNNTVLKYGYDMTGRTIFQENMDNGSRWVFMDVMGKPVQAFTNNTDSSNNSVQLIFEYSYDALRRPLEQWLTVIKHAATDKKLVTLSIYGEGQPGDVSHNLRGKTFQRFDQSGLLQTTGYDFKGNVKTAFKKITIDYKNTADWNVPDKNVLLENPPFNSSSKFDAINRVTTISTPDGSKLSPSYNAMNLLKALNIFSASQNADIPIITQVYYNAKGLRERIIYGNNTATGYTYENSTYRLLRLLTTRNTGSDILQDLNYIYDPVGNITQVTENANQTIFFNNAGVDPGNKFAYDAIYRLTYAEGREFAGQNSPAGQFDTDKTQDNSGNRLLVKGDMNAMQNYEQLYTYDEVGNMLEMVHNAGNGVFSNKWTRDFSYSNANNRLLKTQVGADTTSYNYDAQGNMMNLQNGTFNLAWNQNNQLQQADLGGGGTAYYVYDTGNQRVRKVVENGAFIKDRIYLGLYELYREIKNNGPVLERETLHVMDDRQRIALIETRTKGADKGLPFLIRFQYNNQSGSSCLELNVSGSIISYEEFYPFGNTAYQIMDSQAETPKRYRFTGMERDEETGLQINGARYYVLWLARWLSVDPLLIKNGTQELVSKSSYGYCSDNPVNKIDPAGTLDYFNKEGKLIGKDGKPDKDLKVVMDDADVKKIEGNRTWGSSLLHFLYIALIVLIGISLLINLIAGYNVFKTQRPTDKSEIKGSAIDIPAIVRKDVGKAVALSNKPTNDRPHAADGPAPIVDQYGGYHEEGGFWARDKATGKIFVVNAFPGDYGSPSKDEKVTINELNTGDAVPADYEILGKFHVHPSGTAEPDDSNRLKGATDPPTGVDDPTRNDEPKPKETQGSGFSTGGQDKIPSAFVQRPSAGDLQNIDRPVNIVVGARSGFVYFYDKTSNLQQPFVAKIPLAAFVGN